MAKIEDLNKEIAELRKQLGRVAREPFLSSQIDDASIALRGLKAEFNDLNSDIANLSNQFKNILSEFSSAKFFVNQTRASFKGLVSITEKLRGVQRSGNILSEKELSNIKARQDQEKRNLEFIIEYGNLRGADLENAKVGLAAINGEQSEFNQLLNETITFQDKISNNFGNQIFGGLSKVVKSIPGLSGMAAPFEGAAEAANEASKTNAINAQFAEKQFEASKKQRALDMDALKTGKGLNQDVAKRLGLEGKFKFKKDGNVNMSSFNKKDIDGLAKGVKPITKQMPKGLNVAKAGMQALGKSLAKALGPLGLFIEFVKGLMKADEQAVKLQKNMGFIQKEARVFALNMSQAAAMSGDSSITGTKLLETFHKINDTLGVQMKFNNDILVTSAKFMKHYGVSAEQAGNLALNMAITGKSGKEVQVQQAAIVGSLEEQYGQRLNLQKIAQETANVTGALRANLGGSVVEITKAVAEAKQLGTTIDKIAASQRQLLDFESSVAAEMEAQMLLGRSIDLSNARRLSFQKDFIGAEKELLKQVGTFSDFQNMNVFQQESLAKLTGKSTDELADQLFLLDAQGKTRQELVALGGEERVKAMEAKTAQDKLNASMEQLKQVFVDLGQAFLPILKVVGAIASVISAIVGFTMDLVNGIGYLFGIKSADYEFGDSRGLAALQGGFGNFAGESGADNNLMNDGIIQPDGKIIKTNPRDHIIATQDPGGLVDGGMNSAVLKGIEQTNSILQQLLNKESDIYMDSNKVGTSLSLTTQVQ